MEVWTLAGVDDRAKREKMASSSAEVPYNHPTENILFGQNVIEKISDTCLGQDGKRYYQVKWRDSWEPEERLMAACEGALQTFWKEYYANVEKEIRKQVVSASQTLTLSQPKDVSASISQITQPEVNISKPETLHTIATIPPPEPSPTQQQIQPQIQTVTVHTPTAAITSTSSANVVESFPEQSSTVAYYAVQDNENNIETLETDPSANSMVETTDDINAQAEILTQIINAAPGITATKWTSEKEANTSANRRTLTTITADTLNTKMVGGPDGNSKFHCDICMKSFVSKRNVQRHMLSHTGEKPWMCEYCFKRFRQKPHLEQHVNIHKGIKNAVCNICNKAFNHRSNLVTHMATHSNARPHSCEICGENFKLKHTLSKHMMVHTKQDIDKRHQCKVCKRSFRDKSYLAEHETIHKKDKPWQCDICMKSFSFKRRFQIHLEVHQSKDGGDEYVCHLCPKKFKSKIYLQKHLERHDSKRRRKKKKKLQDGSGGVDLDEGDNMMHDDIDVSNGDNGADDDIDMSMSEVDVKAEGELDGDLEEGEAVDLPTQVSPDGSHFQQQPTQIIQIEGTDENDPNMVVASMLPMNSLNMDDHATYVALAQLTQAAIDNAPMDESGNVILMSYEDIQKQMRDIQTNQQQQEETVTTHQQHTNISQQRQHEGVDVSSLHDIQIAQQQENGDIQITQDATTLHIVQQQQSDNTGVVVEHPNPDFVHLSSDADHQQQQQTTMVATDGQQQQVTMVTTGSIDEQQVDMNVEH